MLTTTRLDAGGRAAEGVRRPAPCRPPHPRRRPSRPAAHDHHQLTHHDESTRRSLQSRGAHTRWTLLIGALPRVRCVVRVRVHGALRIVGGPSALDLIERIVLVNVNEPLSLIENLAQVFSFDGFAVRGGYLIALLDSGLSCSAHRLPESTTRPHARSEHHAGSLDSFACRLGGRLRQLQPDVGAARWCVPGAIERRGLARDGPAGSPARWRTLTPPLAKRASRISCCAVRSRSVAQRARAVRAAGARDEPLAAAAAVAVRGCPRRRSSLALQHLRLA